MLSFQVFWSMAGVETWSRTKKFAAGTRYWSRASASKRISALEPKGMKAFAGSGFLMRTGAGLGEADGDTAGEATAAGLGAAGGGVELAAGAHAANSHAALPSTIAPRK